MPRRVVRPVRMAPQPWPHDAGRTPVYRIALGPAEGRQRGRCTVHIEGDRQAESVRAHYRAGLTAANALRPPPKRGRVFAGRRRRPALGCGEGGYISMYTMTRVAGRIYSDDAAGVFRQDISLPKSPAAAIHYDWETSRRIAATGKIPPIPKVDKQRERLLRDIERLAEAR